MTNKTKNTQITPLCIEIRTNFACNIYLNPYICILISILNHWCSGICINLIFNGKHSCIRVRPRELKMVPMQMQFEINTLAVKKHTLTFCLLKGNYWRCEIKVILTKYPKYIGYLFI